MKKVVLLSAVFLAFAACKQESKPAPDQPVETPADTIKKDTVAQITTKEGKLLAVNFTARTADARFPEILTTEQQEPNYKSFGKKITSDKALSDAAMLKKYQGLKKGDTIQIKFKSKVSSVCKKKGCWMKMDLPQKKNAFVRFKDYEFFVPLNADNSTAIVSGKAYIDEVSVAELKHYAKDGGKSQEEIDKIKEPQITYAFMADGVLLAE
ncbi:DUF4920 domain-containing protein [Flavobacterium sp. MAH-1]|uniref:DUF4920 domain-containing protein n=1 Tax=Flavobacterium agri TaxID=2743471 RepID=A0A7Y8XZ41_9FLAO|nr:DUF4920 domain-containing protein [Flavobacterium agri]NUY79420.1 DUF4920 domain-containing protein [Flavobacterium agri]NYA69445.1 DUF4920 domain-containing protein [Flavobacterium agri]